MPLRFAPIAPESVFRLPGYCVWDPSLVTDAEGRHHLFFSRWPLSAGFEAWVTHSEVCRATAASPLGPYQFAEVVLPRRPCAWDAAVTHNPSIRRFGDRYYLYYNGNPGGADWWAHRNQQRVGLATAPHPTGPWTRQDQPLLPVTPGAWDAKVTTNPSCTATPDGRYLLLYKGVGDTLPAPRFGPVRHGAAWASSPSGPFTKHPVPLFGAGAEVFPGEDPFVWCQGATYHALLKDMGSNYSAASRAIVRFESADGLDWRLARDPVVQERRLTYANGQTREVHRLERPFLYLRDEQPTVFFCGVKPSADEPHAEIVAMAVRA